MSVVNIVSQLLLPVTWWTGAKQSNISLDKDVHINVGKIYILAPVFGWDNKTFVFIEKACHIIVGSLSHICQATADYKIVNIGLINT